MLGPLAGRFLQCLNHLRQTLRRRVIGPLLTPLLQALNLGFDVGLRIAVQQCQLNPALQIAAGIPGVGLQRFQRQIHQSLPGEIAVALLVIRIEHGVRLYPQAHAVHQLAVTGQRGGVQQIDAGAPLRVQAVNIALMGAEQRQRLLRLLFGHPGLRTQLQPAITLILAARAAADLVEQGGRVPGLLAAQVILGPGQGGVGAYRLGQRGKLLLGGVKLGRGGLNGRFRGRRQARQSGHLSTASDGENEGHEGQTSLSEIHGVGETLLLLGE